VSTGHVADTTLAFVIGAGLMVAAGLVEIFLGGRPEGQSLEDIARSLTAERRADRHKSTLDQVRDGLTAATQGLEHVAQHHVTVASAGIGRATVRLFCCGKPGSASSPEGRRDLTAPLGK
jgi:hypothetical protein